MNITDRLNTIIAKASAYELDELNATFSKISDDDTNAEIWCVLDDELFRFESTLSRRTRHRILELIADLHDAD